MERVCCGEGVLWRGCDEEEECYTGCHGVEIY